MSLYAGSMPDIEKFVEVPGTFVSCAAWVAAEAGWDYNEGICSIMVLATRIAKSSYMEMVKT